MKKVNFGTTGLQVPAIVVGCMRLNSLGMTAAAKHIENAIAHDVNFFDHADIYGNGECEELFGKALKMTDLKREDIFVQSKCGIVPGVEFDFSKEYLLQTTRRNCRSSINALSVSSLIPCSILQASASAILLSTPKSVNNPKITRFRSITDFPIFSPFSVNSTVRSD